MLELGRHANREVVCLLTDMDQPLGAAVGNALEIAEARDTVRGEGPPDFTELVLDACARLLALSDLGVDVEEGQASRRGRGRRRLGARRLRALDPRAGRRSRSGRAAAGAGRAARHRSARGLRDAAGRDRGRHRRAPSRRRPPRRRTTRSTTRSASSATPSAARASRRATCSPRCTPAIEASGAEAVAGGARARTSSATSPPQSTRSCSTSSPDDPPRAPRGRSRDLPRHRRCVRRRRCRRRSRRGSAPRTGYVPELAFVVEEEGEIVAHTMLSRVRLEGPEVDVLILTPDVRPSRTASGRGSGRS